jgi:adenine-specific DNA methylase
MTWDFAETNPIAGGSGNIGGAIDWVVKVIETTAQSSKQAASVIHGFAQQPAVTRLEAVITDPPYYDSVPYSHLADFFYVWLKRILGERLPDLFNSPLCPKGQEIVQDRPHKLSNSKKTKEYFELEMTKALAAASDAIVASGIVVVVYAHKTTAAWETLVQALLRAGLCHRFLAASHRDDRRDGQDRQGGPGFLDLPGLPQANTECGYRALG